MKLKRRAAFTLVELLVVIAIIGVLVALLLPAVQAAREAARRTQCTNQIRQIALAFQLHHDAHQFFPSGGWGYRWTGDSDRGFGKTQPGSWAFSCLPFMEAGQIHKIGAGITSTLEEKTPLSILGATPVEAFYCPSRRAPAAYPHVAAGLTSAFVNSTSPPALARSDYAANLGPRISPYQIQWGSGPSSITQATFNQGFLENTLRSQYGADIFTEIRGIVYQRSEIEGKHITDGLSNTMLLGEKNVNPDYYLGTTDTLRDQGDDQGAWVGDDLDIHRFTDVSALPAPDQAGLSQIFSFGSAHPSGFLMAMCDVSIKSVSFDVDPVVFRLQGDRSDDQPVSSAN